MANYTITLKDLVGTGYNVFDDTWNTFDPEHKQELCDKILRHYWFYEIGQETPDRFKHYLNEQLALIMPYYNKLYESELLKVSPLYNYFIDEIGDQERADKGLRDKLTRFDTSSLRQMADSLKRLEDGTLNTTGNLKNNGNETWSEDKVGEEDTLKKESRSEKQVTDQDTVDKTTLNRTLDHTGDETGKETMADTAEGTKTVDSTSSTTTSNTRRYSDTPQGVITSSGGLSIDAQYLTNYTQDNGTQSSTGHDAEEIKNTENKTTDTTKNTVNKDTENATTDATGQKDVTVDTTATIDTTTDTDYSEHTNGSRNTTFNQDTVGKQLTHGETSQFTNGSTQDRRNDIGAENESTSQNQTVKLTGTKKGFTISQSELLEAYRKTFLNIDRMIIEDLAENFMGVF